MYYARKELFSILIEVLKSDEKCFETLKSFILVVKYIKKHCMFLMRWGGGVGCGFLRQHAGDPVADKRRGDQKSENIADIICERSLMCSQLSKMVSLRV